MTNLSLPNLELTLIGLLQRQGLAVEEMRLIGLLGQGTRATVFSAMIDGVYHVLKVYDSRDSLQAELKNLKKMIPKERFLFWWDENFGAAKLNLVIIEVPEGRELSSDQLTPDRAAQVADHLAQLHSIRYRQRVSLTGLKEQLRRHSQPFLAHIKLMQRDPVPYQKLLDQMARMLDDQPEIFRANKVRIHGDLWWPNIIVAKEDVYLIDWEDMRRGDAAEDIAKLRIIIYWLRNLNAPAFFWQDPEHADCLGLLMQAIASRHQQICDDPNFEYRLRFYLPLFCIRELAERYLALDTNSDLDRSVNQIWADEALLLTDKPLAAPPDIERYGYWEQLQQLTANHGGGL